MPQKKPKVKRKLAYTKTAKKTKSEKSMKNC